jgi:hypothetical protein
MKMKTSVLLARISSRPTGRWSEIFEENEINDVSEITDLTIQEVATLFSDAIPPETFKFGSQKVLIRAILQLPGMEDAEFALCSSMKRKAPNPDQGSTDQGSADQGSAARSGDVSRTNSSTGSINARNFYRPPSAVYDPDDCNPPFAEDLSREYSGLPMNPRRKCFVMHTWGLKNLSKTVLSQTPPECVHMCDQFSNFFPSHTSMQEIEWYKDYMVYKRNTAKMDYVTSTRYSLPESWGRLLATVRRGSAAEFKMKNLVLVPDADLLNIIFPPNDLWMLPKFLKYGHDWMAPSDEIMVSLFSRMQTVDHHPWLHAQPDGRPRPQVEKEARVAQTTLAKKRADSNRLAAIAKKRACAPGAFELQRNDKAGTHPWGNPQMELKKVLSKLKIKIEIVRF